MDSVTVSGSITRDPEIRYTHDGQANVTFGIAINRRWQAQGSDTWEESTSFLDVVAWRELAENVAMSFVKGDRVVITGRIEQHAWETEAGERRSRVEITADDIGASVRFATCEVSRTRRGLGEDVGWKREVQYCQNADCGNALAVDDVDGTCAYCATRDDQ